MKKESPIADMRQSYERGHLDRGDLASDPLVQFSDWFEKAATAHSHGGFFRRFGVATYKWFNAVIGKPGIEANAMTLATADRQGNPSARTVLLKGVDGGGFVFFSHFDGPKGRELAENPRAALVFHWTHLERQVCISGVVSRITEAESAKYFNSRPRGSRLSTWVSKQSAVVPDREFLQTKWEEVQKQFPGEVPKPDYWGGFRLVPTKIEFWQGRPSRLHDRFLYTRDERGCWKIERLAP